MKYLRQSKFIKKRGVFSSKAWCFNQLQSGEGPIADGFSMAAVWARVRDHITRQESKEQLETNWGPKNLVNPLQAHLTAPAVINTEDQDFNTCTLVG